MTLWSGSEGDGVSFRWYCGTEGLMVGHYELIWRTGVSLFVSKARTASGATAAQIAVKEGSVHRIVEHLGLARIAPGLVGQ